MGHSAIDLKYRFQWTFPIVALAVHDPNMLYATSQYVHRTTNDGQSWQVISPDLTRNDPRDARPLRRPDHEGPDVGGVLRRHLRLRRVAEAEGRAVGGER